MIVVVSSATNWFVQNMRYKIQAFRFLMIILYGSCTKLSSHKDFSGSQAFYKEGGSTLKIDFHISGGFFMVYRVETDLIP